jgi:hypothetical protein
MKKLFSLIILTLVLGVGGYGLAETFPVSDVASFQSALTKAESNLADDTIIVAAGIYDLASTLVYTPVPVENHSLTILGAGAGSTILDGGNSVRILDMDTTNVVGDAGADVVVRGMSFQKGDSGSNSGGGLRVETNAAAVTVESCEFSDNSNSGDGGGLYVRTSSGAITLTNNTFSGNSAGSGGGAYNESSSGAITLTGNSFTGNNTISEGAGTYVDCNSGAVNFTNNTFSGNSAGWEGGGASIYPSSGSATLTNNIFSGNTSVNFGGGAYVHTHGLTVTMTNNTFTGMNSALFGGGLYVALYEDTVKGNIYNNILWGNTATTDGDDVYVDNDADDNDTVSPVNLFNNDYADFASNLGVSLSQGNNMNQDPLLTADFHLQAGSPCIDAGQNGAPGIPLIDFEGDSRTIDGNGDGSSVADMGADEYNPGAPVAPAGGGGGGGGCFIATVSMNN